VQHQLAALQRLTAGLAVARTRTDVADAFSASGAGAFGALDVWLVLHDAPSRTLELLGTSGDHPGAEMVRSVALDGDAQPATTVLQEGRALYFGSAGELVARYPHLATSVASMGTGAFAAVPLSWQDQVVGVLAMSYATARAFDDAERRLLTTVANLGAQALERIRLAEHEHHAVIELQHAMLGQPDSIRFANVGYAYRPADGQLEVGGDWYDIIALSAGRCGLVVGDVVGHDVPAAATMGQLRNATRALAMIIDDPAEVVTQLERFMIGLEPARASTMLYAVFDPLDRSLRYHCAGHLPPLMTTTDGSSYLEEGRGAPLGVLTPPRATATITLPPAARLLLYTDGLIERRSESLDIGMARLVDAVDRLADLDEDALCRALVIEMVDESDVRDDIAVLAVRPMPRSFRARINADAAEIRPLRHRVRDWLESIHIASDRIDEIVLSLSEAVTNAVEHAYHRQPQGRIEVEGAVDGDRLELTIRDHGEWRSGPPRSDGGRGVDVMRALSVEMRLETGTNGTTVRVVHDLFEPRRRRST